MDIRNIIFPAAAAIVTFLSHPAQAEPPKVDRLEIVDHAIEEHGGSLYRNTETVLRQCSRSGCFDIRARVHGGLYEYEVEREQDGRRARVTNESVESWSEGRAILVTGEEAQRVRSWVDARIYFPFLPFRLNDDSVYKQDLGIVDWNGRELHLVKVTFVPDSSSGSSSEYLYWFDPSSARMEQYAYSFEGSPGGLRLRQTSNYRRVGGLLFSDQDNLGIDGDDLDIDLIDAEWAAANLEAISRVELEDIEVRPIEPN